MDDLTIKSGTQPATGPATTMAADHVPTAAVQADTETEAIVKQEADDAPNTWPAAWTAVNAVHQTNAGVIIEAREREGTPSADIDADRISATAKSTVDEIDGASVDHSVNVPVLADTVAPDASSPNNNSNTTVAVPTAHAVRVSDTDNANINEDDDPSRRRNAGERWTQLQKYWLYRFREIQKPPVPYEQIGQMLGKTALACRICALHTRNAVKDYGEEEVFSDNFPQRRAGLKAKGRGRKEALSQSSLPSNPKPRKKRAPPQGSRSSNPRSRGQSSREKATEARNDANNSLPAREASLALRPCAKSDTSLRVSVAEPVSRPPIPSIGPPLEPTWGDNTVTDLGARLANWRGLSGERVSEQESMPALGPTSSTVVAKTETETEEAQASRPPTRKGPARKDRASKYQASKAETSTARVRKPETTRSRGKAAVTTINQVSPEAPKFSGKKYPEPAPKFAERVSYAREQMSVLTQPRDEDYTDSSVTAGVPGDGQFCINVQYTSAEDSQSGQPELTYARSTRTGPVDSAVAEAANALLGLGSRDETSATQTRKRWRDPRFIGLSSAQIHAFRKRNETSASNLATVTGITEHNSPSLLPELTPENAAQSLERNTVSQAPEPRRSNAEISDRMSISKFLTED